MIRFLAKRVRYSLLVLWGVITFVFLLFNVLPADHGPAQRCRIPPKYPPRAEPG